MGRALEFFELEVGLAVRLSDRQGIWTVTHWTPERASLIDPIGQRTSLKNGSDRWKTVRVRRAVSRSRGASA